MKHIDLNKSRKLLLALCGVYWGIAALVCLIAFEQFFPAPNTTAALLTYWAIILVVFLFGSLYVGYSWKQMLKGKGNTLVSLLTVYNRYGFLIKQLVSRDFKTKYKRSVLGVAWSFLNPLLSMCVQYVVFSNLFRRSTPNYPTYLLTGIVFFNFFSEAASMGLMAITNNSSLIRKVLVPKYIFPFTRVLSSLINFAISLIPLMIVVLLTGLSLKPSFLLLFYDVSCMLCFIMGMVLLLCTSMTFFQDTKFLWRVISLMWTYLTPIFYVETIIPESFLPIYRLNPMYQFITFARTCIIDGVSPAPMAYVQCFISGALVLLAGIVVFKRNQKKFVLHL